MLCFKYTVLVENFKETFLLFVLGWRTPLQAWGEEQDDWEEDPGSAVRHPGQEQVGQRTQRTQRSGRHQGQKSQRFAEKGKRKGNRVTDKQNHIKTDRKVNVLQRKVGERETDWLKNRQTNKQTNKQTYIKTDRKINVLQRKGNKQTEE